MAAFDNLKLRNKLLIPIVISSAAIAGIIAFSSAELRSASQEAQESFNTGTGASSL